MKNMLLAENILHCQEIGFSHILHLSLLDLMILFCEMHLISPEALMQNNHKTLPFFYSEYTKKTALPLKLVSLQLTSNVFLIHSLDKFGVLLGFSTFKTLVFLSLYLDWSLY